MRNFFPFMTMNTEVTGIRADLIYTNYVIACLLPLFVIFLCIRMVSSTKKAGVLTFLLSGVFAAWHRERPEICLGSDAYFTPGTLLAAAEDYFVQKGLHVAVNTPFAGAIVPEPFYSSRDKRVRSLMIEVNRSLYMNEETGEKNEAFDEVQNILREFLQQAGNLF